MGYALYWGRKYEWCTKWMSNWKEMDGVQRWMLMNLNRALRNLGRETEAEQINRRVLEIEPGNSFANLYLAFDLACKGDAQTAETLLQNVKENDLQNDYKLYLMLTREIVGFLKTDRAHRVPFWQARDRLRRHRRALAKPSWEFRRAYFLGLARLAGLSRQPNAFYYRLSTARILGSLFHASDQAWFFLRRLKVLLFWRPGRFINP
jgi:tetratricopeptide (TPR) repeat protein